MVVNLVLDLGQKENSAIPMNVTFAMSNVTFAVLAVSKLPKLSILISSA